MSVPVTINNIVLLNLYVTKALHIRLIQKTNIIWMLGSASIGFVLPLVVFTLIFSGRNIKYIFILLLQRKSGRIVDQMTEAAQRKKKKKKKKKLNIFKLFSERPLTYLWEISYIFYTFCLLIVKKFS